MRLDIGVLGMEQLLGSLDSQVLDSVYVGAASVVAALWITFSILVS